MPTPPADDARLLVARLYDTHGTGLYRYALLLTADAAAAEDVVHGVFAALLRLREPLEHEEHYLRRAVRNACYSVLRQRGREDVAATDVLLVPITSSGGHEERLAIQAALRTLAPEQREVVALHIFEGLTFREIAAATEVSINTVAARYRYALAHMRKSLAPLGVRSDVVVP